MSIESYPFFLHLLILQFNQRDNPLSLQGNLRYKCAMKAGPAPVVIF